MVDTSVFVAIVLVNDAHHKTAKKLVTNLIEKGKSLVTNHLVFQEALTVAVLRSRSLAPAGFLRDQIFSKKAGVEIKHLPVSWEDDISTFFLNQKKYRAGFLSFIDCSLIIQARKQNIPSIFTFDNAFNQFSGEFNLIGLKRPSALQ